MAAKLQQLITVFPGKILRERVALILAEEFAGQKALAVLASADQTPYDVRVFTNRMSPVDAFSDVDTRPLINVWRETFTTEKSKSNSVNRQRGSAHTVHVDCYGSGKATKLTTDTHVPADELAADVAERTAEIANAILFSAWYHALGLGGAGGLVQDRWVSEITLFQPELAKMPATWVMGARLDLQVTTSQDFQENPGQTPIEINTTILRAEDGSILAQA